jgi:hypothetical protein
MWAWSFRWLQFRGKGIVSKKKKKRNVEETRTDKPGKKKSKRSRISFFIGIPKKRSRFGVKSLILNGAACGLIYRFDSSPAGRKGHASLADGTVHV